jgi:hypothetical protein
MDALPPRAFSGEVESGSPPKMRQLAQTEHDPVQYERIMLQVTNQPAAKYNPSIEATPPRQEK